MPEQMPIEVGVQWPIVIAIAGVCFAIGLVCGAKIKGWIDIAFGPCNPYIVVKQPIVKWRHENLNRDITPPPPPDRMYF